jgi:hypothetical protein
MGYGPHLGGRPNGTDSAGERTVLELARRVTSADRRVAERRGARPPGLGGRTPP